jgi:hypothetical protein
MWLPLKLWRFADETYRLISLLVKGQFIEAERVRLRDAPAVIVPGAGGLYG